MPEWFSHLPNWLVYLWLIYVTFHDLVQWGIITLISLFAWKYKKNKKEIEAELKHVHQELHEHIKQDAALHKELGQVGITEGK